MNMIQATCTLVVLCLATPQSLAFITPQTSQDVNSMCAATTCETGTVCRVVQATSDASPAAACLTCVPDGADSVCNTSGFWNAVLVGDVITQGNLTPLACENGAACPAGATCVTTENGQGVCCYGNNGSPVTNVDTRCPM